MKAMKRHSFLFLIFLMLPLGMQAQRTKFNFNLDWQLLVTNESPDEFFSAPHQGKAVTLPHAMNEGEAFRVAQNQLSTGVAWYWKEFVLPGRLEGKKVFIEFEGGRQALEVFVNRQRVGLSENGVMAFGFDITPYLREGKNEIAVCTDNRRGYKERATGTTFQWNDMTFNANYGGITRNVNLYITGPLYQTLPLYNGLGTTGTYIYARDFDIRGRRATVCAESQVKNETDKPQAVTLEVEVCDADGRVVKQFRGKRQTLQPGETNILSASSRLSGLHFWSVGYGYLYTVNTSLLVNGSIVDKVSTRTGFRKTQFGQGKIWLNDRVLMVKGYAQRSTNEWPYVGTDVPAWMSDYSNALMVADNANTVRWMHITPSRQDVESCDRVGLIQALPAGDHEGDVGGRQWEQRVEVMRDAIIYNRNNPSVLFYEGGNESISRDHMKQLIALRNEFDPHGGRAMGSREMLDIDEAEYGGEMLYINKSKKHPMWAMEYCRDEGYRLYWDNLSYPWHQHGAGPYLRKQPAPDYNQNQDRLTVEQVRRWYDFWRVRPGMGDRVSSGGVKIIFSETNTHNRSEFNYRVSGVVDAMRTPKQGYRAHHVMWSGWVENDTCETFIVGHWNYLPGVKKDIYVVSNTPETELFVNGRSVGRARAEYDFLHTFRNVEWEKGCIKAVGYGADGAVASVDSIETAGEAHHLRLTLIENPAGTRADGTDMALVEVEVVDKAGRRCPLDNRFIRFSTSGPCEWLGGIAKSPDGDNYIGATTLPVECGVNRVMVRSTRQAGHIVVRAEARGLAPVEIGFDTQAVDDKGGLSTYHAGDVLPLHLGRGETPLTPSYTDQLRTIAIASAEAGYDSEGASKSFDDNELSEWKNDGRGQSAWIRYVLKEPAIVDQIDIKLTGWRQRSYPLEIYADQTLVWKGNTPKTLGYVHLALDKPVKASTYTIRQTGAADTKDGFGGIVEVAATTAGELDLYKTPGSEKVNSELRIVEIDFLQRVR